VKHLIASLLCGLSILNASGSTVLGESLGVDNWLSPHYRDHKLVGKIWSSETKSFISGEQLIAKLTKARFVLLGETHPNKDHHLLQAKFLEIIAKAADHPPRLVVEMIPESMGPTLNKFRHKNPDETGKLGDVLNWKKRGWGDWQNYQPIFEVAYKYKLPIFPGNIDRNQASKISRSGISGVNEADKKKFSLSLEYSQSQSKMLDDMLFDSHCKMMPRKRLAPMKLVQQIRDGAMARPMLGSDDGGKAVLIAGAGHVRKDWAVPRILHARAPDSLTLSIAFIEVSPDDINPQSFEPASADKSPVFDYMYFTPKAEIKDYCADLIKHFKKKKKN